MLAPFSCRGSFFSTFWTLWVFHRAMIRRPLENGLLHTDAGGAFERFTETREYSPSHQGRRGAGLGKPKTSKTWKTIMFYVFCIVHPHVIEKWMFHLGWTDIPGPLLRIMLVFVVFFWNCVCEFMCVWCVCGGLCVCMCVCAFVCVTWNHWFVSVCVRATAVSVCLCVRVCLWLSAHENVVKDRTFSALLMTSSWKSLQKLSFFSFLEDVLLKKHTKDCAFSAF